MSNPLILPPNLPPISRQTDPEKHNVAAIIGGVMYDMPARGIGMTEDELRILGEFALYHLQGGLTFETQSDADTWAPILELRRTRTTPSGSQKAGGLSFTASDSALNTDEYAYILARSVSPTTTAESGALYFGNRYLGSWYDAFNLQGTGAINVLGGAITFPATQIAYSGANTLDDYEEGTWTPVYTPVTGAFGTITYNAARYGKYTKIGRAVLIEGRILTDTFATGTATNGIRVSGLPFTPAVSGGAVAIGYAAGWSGAAPKSGFIVTDSMIWLYVENGAYNANMTNLVSNTAPVTGSNSGYNDMAFSGVYFV